MTTALSELFFEDVREGMETTTFSLPLTVQRLVMEAGVNRDFAPIHHDREVARATGAPDMYANTMLLQAIFEAMLRTWMGLGGRLRRLAFSMRIFNCAGDQVTARGRVTCVREVDGEGRVDVEVWIETHRGVTVTGDATVSLPRRATSPRSSM